MYSWKSLPNFFSIGLLIFPVITSLKLLSYTDTSLILTLCCVPPAAVAKVGFCEVLNSAEPALNPKVVLKTVAFMSVSTLPKLNLSSPNVNHLSVPSASWVSEGESIKLLKLYNQEKKEIIWQMLKFQTFIPK